MSQQVSPFAALTGAEQQLKWLEYQSVRLPYTQAMPEPKEMTEAPPNTAESAVRREPETPRPAQPSQPASAARVEREAFQRTRHSQYDAVIARMKRAQQQATTYQNAP